MIGSFPHNVKICDPSLQEPRAYNLTYGGGAVLAVTNYFTHPLWKTVLYIKKIIMLQFPIFNHLFLLFIFHPVFSFFLYLSPFSPNFSPFPSLFSFIPFLFPFLSSSPSMSSLFSTFCSFCPFLLVNLFSPFSTFSPYSFLSFSYRGRGRGGCPPPPPHLWLRLWRSPRQFNRDK